MSRLWRYRTILLVGFPVLLAGIYSLLGFVILPLVVKQTLTHSFARHIQQSVAVDDIYINPYRLELQVSGFYITDKNQVILLGFDELALDVDTLSLFTAENIIQHVHLKEPRITFVANKNGHAELLDVLSKAQTFFTTADQDKKTPLPALWIQQLQITDATVDATATLAEGKTTKTVHETLHFPSIALADFHTRQSTNANRLIIEMADGHNGTLKLNTVVRLEPLQLSGDVKINDFNTERFMPLLAMPYQLRLQPFLINAATQFSVSYSDALHIALRKGNVDLQNLAIQKTDFTQPLLVIPAITISGIAMDYPQQHLNIDNINLRAITLNMLSSANEDATTKILPPLLEIPLLTIKGITMDAAKQQLDITSILWRDSKSDVIIDKQGKLNLQTLADTILAEKPSAVATPAPAKATPSTPWQISIAEAGFSNHSLHVRNEQLATPLYIRLFPVSLAVQNLKPLDNKSIFPLQVQAGIMGADKNADSDIRITATIARETLSVDAQAIIRHWPLMLFQPYVDEYATVDIKQGYVDAQIDMQVAAQDKLDIEAKGNVDVVDFRLRKKNSKKKLLSWKILSMEQLHYTSSNNRLHINNVSVDKSYGRFIINADGTSNVQDLMLSDKASNESTQDAVQDAVQEIPTDSTTGITAVTAQPDPFPVTQNDTTVAVADDANDGSNTIVHGEQPLQFDIDVVHITDGEMGFSDLSLSPSFRLVMKQLDGEIRKMSSDANIQAVVNLQGKVNRYAPAKIAGTFNLLSEKPQLNMQMAFKNIDLTTFTPYSGVYAGYVIKKGQISVDLHYRLVNERIQGENHIIISQLMLGEKVKSDRIIDVPVKLAIALLQDENGLIDLGFNVNGYVNDPQFDIGKIVSKAFKDTLKKAVSAPFKFFKNLFKRSERSIQNLVFDEGSDVINAATEEKLQVVATIMSKRDLLQLSIQGNALPEKDIPALQQQILLQTLEADSNISENEFLPEANPAANAKTYQALGDLYKSQQAKSMARLEEQHAKALLEKSAAMPVDKAARAANALLARQLSYAQAWQELVGSMPVSADDIDDLAIQRAREVKALLVEKYHIGAERIFVLSNHTDTDKQSLATQLILDAR